MLCARVQYGRRASSMVRPAARRSMQPAQSPWLISGALCVGKTKGGGQGTYRYAEWPVLHPLISGEIP